MRRALALLAALGLLAALVPAVAAAPVGVTKAADLYAGQTTDVGDVYVWNSATHLYVEIDLAAGWCMSESHVAVAANLAGIPKTKTGNPIPGQFAEGDYYNPCADGDTFMFPLTGLGATPVIAVHAKVWEMVTSTATIVSDVGMSNPVAFAETYPNFGAPVAAVVPTFAGTGTWPAIAGASYISNQAAGDPFNVNRWRQVTETLTVPGLPVGGELWVNSDNYEFTKLNTVEIQRDQDAAPATVEGIGGEPAGASPQTWSTVEHVVFTPKMGSNAFEFVFRNSIWDGCCGFVDNPTGLIYKASATYYAHSESAWAGTAIGTIGFPGANWATYFTYTLQNVLLETVTVPATVPAGATSTTVLANGVDYLFKVTGTVTWTNRGGADLVDAECTSESGGPWAAAAAGYPDALLELQVNATDVDWTPVGTANAAGCADGHEYTLAFTGTGAAVTFRIYDGTGNVQDPAWFGDNAGALTVQIWRVMP